MEFLVRGATQYGEPGVFVSFEENADELTRNVASLGFDLDALVADRKLALDHVHVERSEIEETGEYDLEGLFVRLGYAIDSVGAKRVVLDTLEARSSPPCNEGILRAEIRRLFRWLKDRGVTAVITGERGDGTFTRRGLEEYVSDCVILLDARVVDQVATRRLRVVKYRGTAHGTNEYPLPHPRAGHVRAPGHVHRPGSRGLERAHLHRRAAPRHHARRRGPVPRQQRARLGHGRIGQEQPRRARGRRRVPPRRALPVLRLRGVAEPDRPQHAARSALDLAAHVASGLLRVRASRPTGAGLEMHLALMHREIEAFAPRVCVVDPITNLVSVGSNLEVWTMLVRLIDFLKSRDVTAVFATLTGGADALEQTEIGVSSLADTWLLVRTIEVGGERNRGLYVLKSRGMAHSNQIREFVMTERGIQLLDVYTGSAGVLTGAARTAQEAKERAEAGVRQQEIERRRRDLERRRQLVDAQIGALRAELAAQEDEVELLLRQDGDRDVELGHDRAEQARLRQADTGHDGVDPRTPGPRAGETNGAVS